MPDAYGLSPHDIPTDEELGLEPEVIPNRPMCRHELRDWLVATLQAREIVEEEADA